MADLYFDDWGTGSNMTVPQSSAPAWWETTLQNVITAAANYKFSTNRLEGNQQYVMTADGRLVPAGAVVGTIQQPTSAMPAWAPLAFVGLGVLLLVKVMK